MFIWYINNQNSFFMAKKKIKPSDLDLTPKAVGESMDKAIPDETNELHCTPTEMTICVSGLDCFQSKYSLCEDDSLKCAGTIACPGTNNCVDSRSAAIQCCAHTGNDCVESGNNCPGTDRTCGCIVYTDDCGLTLNNACPETFNCKSVEGGVCELSAVVEECPETIRNCGSKEFCPILTSNDCDESTDENCIRTDNCPIFTTTKTFIDCQE